MILRGILALLIAFCAMMMDLKKQKIPNRLMLFCLFAAIIGRVLADTMVNESWLDDTLYWWVPGYGRSLSGYRFHLVAFTVRDMFFGAIIPLLILGWSFFFRMTGAADLKLLSVLGILLGAFSSFLCVILSLAIGAVFSFGIMGAHNNFKERFTYFAGYIQRFILTHEREPYRKEWDSASNLHLTVPIFMSVAILVVILGVF